MSRLRRLVVADHWFFCYLPRLAVAAPNSRKAAEEGKPRPPLRYAAWVFLPDHWHAIFYPAHPLTMSRVMESIKDAATKRINHSRRQAGRLLQPRFFDRALRTLREYNEKVEYIHLNPVNAGLVRRAEEWPWSSVHDYTGSTDHIPATPSGLSVDRVWLPFDERTRI